jgi:methylthioribose-1-phosphate isomerase
MNVNEELFKEYYKLSNEERQSLLDKTTDNVFEYMNMLIKQLKMTKPEAVNMILRSMLNLRKEAMDNEQYEKVEILDKLKVNIESYANT